MPHDDIIGNNVAMQEALRMHLAMLALIAIATDYRPTAGEQRSLRTIAAEFVLAY